MYLCLLSLHMLLHMLSWFSLTQTSPLLAKLPATKSCRTNLPHRSEQVFEDRARCLRSIAIDADESGLTNIKVLMPVAIDSRNDVYNAVENSKTNQEEGIVLRRGSSIYTPDVQTRKVTPLKLKT